MYYYYLKSFHIIFVITWFAGLFYLGRLFIYHREASDFKDDYLREKFCSQYALMEKRLWYGITWPSAILTFLLGPSLIYYYLPLEDNVWVLKKLFFVLMLFVYHLKCGKMRKGFELKNFPYSSMQLRYWNEVPTLFLFTVVFLAVFKDEFSLITFSKVFVPILIILIVGTKIYKKQRDKSKS